MSHRKKSALKQSRISLAASETRAKGSSSNSKFLNAFKKRSQKVEKVVKAIKRDSKVMKLRMLGLANKKNYVDYGDGFREFYPQGWENRECWMSDLSDDSEGRLRGLLPLRSEIDYKRRLHGQDLVCEFNEVKFIDSKGRIRIR